MKLEIIKIGELIRTESGSNNYRSWTSDIHIGYFKLNDVEYSIEVYSSGFLLKYPKVYKDNIQVNISDETYALLDKAFYKYQSDICKKREII